MQIRWIFIWRARFRAIVFVCVCDSEKWAWFNYWCTQCGGGGGSMKEDQSAAPPQTIRQYARSFDVCVQRSRPINHTASCVLLTYKAKWRTSQTDYSRVYAQTYTHVDITGRVYLTWVCRECAIQMQLHEEQRAHPNPNAVHCASANRANTRAIDCLIIRLWLATLDVNRRRRRQSRHEENTRRYCTRCNYALRSSPRYAVQCDSSCSCSHKAICTRASKRTYYVSLPEFVCIRKSVAF